MHDLDWRVLTVRLGREFNRRAMTTEVKSLREFYVRRAREKKANAARGRPLWDEDVVLDWLAMLRIPPFEHVYTLRPPNAPCPRCRSSAKGHEGPNWIRTSFPGGALIQCQGCGERWLTSA
jgi:hypothetical protein